MDRARRHLDGSRRGLLNVHVRIDEAECRFDATNPRDLCILVERFLRHLGARTSRPMIFVAGHGPATQSWVLEYLNGILLEIYGRADR